MRCRRCGASPAGAAARLLAVLVATACLSGCYVLQAARGQMNLMAKRQPISEIIADPATSAALRARLQYVSEARDFASRELALPDNDSYRSYADIGRPYVVWNVFATDEFSVEPRRWCFPIAGCVVYRGYFSEEAAQRYAQRLSRRGADVTVEGVAAYSTLGHFRDPLLSTMMSWSDARLAGTLFHELAHQVLYVPGDSAFNEAFATVVEEVGLERWLGSNGRAHEFADWQVQRRRHAEFIDLLLETRERLAALYRLDLPPEEMRRRKQREFGRMKFEYVRLKERWNGYSGYDRWFDRALNNAHLVSAATYYACLPGFRAKLAALGGDLPRFYEEVRELSKSADARRALCAVSDEMS